MNGWIVRLLSTNNVLKIAVTPYSLVGVTNVSEDPTILNFWLLYPEDEGSKFL
jgi:hypothetical protein